MKIKINILIISFVVALAFFLRIYKISNIPPSLNWDEVSLGYNAYSVLKTGKDEWGKILPVIFTAYGDYKLPGYIYTLVPFISIFGLNAFAIRLPSVLAGTITVLFTYLTVLELFSNNQLNQKEKRNVLNHDFISEGKINIVAFTASLLVVIEPWSLFLSRPAFEANLALCFFVIAVYLFLRSIHTIKYLPPSILFFGLTVWTYNSYRIFTPLFIVFLTILYRKELLFAIKTKQQIIFNVFLFILLFLPMFYQLLIGVGQERYQKVAIVDEGAVGQIVNLRNKYSLNPLLEKLFFNRPVYFTGSFIKNWITFYSDKFLYSQGGTNYQFSVPGFGLLYPINIIFLVIGIIYLFVKRANKSSMVLLFIFLMGSIPSSLTRESPHVLRSITLLPSPAIITAIGAVNFFIWFQKNERLTLIRRFVRLFFIPLTIVVYLLFLGQAFGKYYSYYLNEYPKEYSWSWQYGYREAVNYIKDNYDNFDKIIVTKKYGEPHEFVLFYLSWNPQNYFNSSNLIRFRQTDWFWVDRFDKFYFVNDWDIPTEEWQPFVLESEKEEVDCRGINCLLITSPGNVPKGWSKLQTINYLNCQPVYEIYDNKQN